MVSRTSRQDLFNIPDDTEEHKKIINDIVLNMYDVFEDCNFEHIMVALEVIIVAHIVAAADEIQVPIIKNKMVQTGVELLNAHVIKYCDKILNS